MEEQEKEVHKKRSIIATIFTLLFLVGVGWFAWRVYYYADQIKSGKLSAEELEFSDQQSINRQLASMPLPSDDGRVRPETQDQPSLGSPEAAVTIVEFADFGCPYSRESSFVVRGLAQRYGDRVHYVYRDFPVTELHPRAKDAAQAAECARDQGKFWQYHDKLYQNQTRLSDAALSQYARQINLDMDQFKECIESDKHMEEVESDYQAGIDAGVRGTPTFFINGIRIPGSIPEETLDILINRLLEDAEENQEA
jgi:protein-disulfide isomerase